MKERSLCATVESYSYIAPVQQSDLDQQEKQALSPNYLCHKLSITLQGV